MEERVFARRQASLARFIPDDRVKPASLHGEYRSRPAQETDPRWATCST